MQAYNIDLVMTQANKVVKNSNVEELRVSVVLGIHRVLAKIGLEFTGQVIEIPAEIKNHKWRIPDNLIHTIQVTSQPSLKNNLGIGQGYQVSPGQISPIGISYYQTAMELNFLTIERGDVWVMGYGMYVDEDGEVIIPQLAFDACVEYCTFKCLDDSNNPKNPKWQERLIMEQRSDAMIVEARGNFNRTSSDRFRAYNTFR